MLLVTYLPSRQLRFAALALVGGCLGAFRFATSAAKLVGQLLQLPTMHPPALSMRQLIQQQQQQQRGGSSAPKAVQPMLFVTTAGADPSQELVAIAEAEVGRERLHEVAMGQGQAEVALQLLKSCAATGELPRQLSKGIAVHACCVLT